MSSNYPSKNWLYLTLFLSGWLLASCNSTQFIKVEEGERFLNANKIVLNDTADLKKKSKISFELEKLFIQKPNGRFFGVPRQYFYCVSFDTIDKSKIGLAFSKSILRAGLGEYPVLVDSAVANQTAQVMKGYLLNSGYFFAEVEHDITTNRKGNKATVNYYVKPGGQFTIDTLIYDSKDSVMQGILEDISEGSFLKKGAPVDVKLYEQEVSRIITHLRNNGYAYFYPQYISNLEAIDSSNVSRTVQVKMEVFNPPNEASHKACSVGNIYIYPEYDPVYLALMMPDTLIEGLFFSSGGKPFRVKPRTIANAIFFRTGEVFNQEELDNSIRQLGGLGIFRPPTIRFEEDSVHAGVLNFFVLLTPNKKWEAGYDFDMSFSERKGQVGARNLVGLSFSPSLRNRNFFKGAELLVGTVDMGIELAPFDAKENSIVNTLDLRIQGDLFIPRFSDPFKVWRGLKNAHLVSPVFYEKLRKKATSRASSGYNLLVLWQNYSLHFANLSFGYDVSLKPNRQLSINHLGLDLLKPDIIKGSPFDDLLETQDFLKRSFSDQFITGIIFRDLTYAHTSKPSPSGAYWFIRGYFDLSGLEMMGFNEFYKTFTGEKVGITPFGAEFSHYAKFEFDLRRFWQMGPNSHFGMRVNSGIANPYYRSEEVPYVKQFFVGGPNSIRGWYARSLGPGLFYDPTTNDPGQRNLFYQAANLKWEMNLEYRFLVGTPFNLFKLYGAFFFDSGNIWTFKKDPDRPGSQLALSRVRDENGKIIQDHFLKELALGTGFGTRWDFTYATLRLDLGFPLRNNYPDAGRNDSYWYNFSKYQLRTIVFNLGLGYPF